VRAIDPEGREPEVERVALAELDAPAGSFDAAVALLSLHHVSPLAESMARLAEVVRPGGRILVDEFDVDALDERAAAWWLERRRERGADEHQDPASLVAGRRGHVHPVARLREELGRFFDLEAVRRGSYLYRWDLGADLRADEERLIAAGELPAVGARWVGVRRA
jgi:SAM-dependent methyltransferase